MGQKELSLKDFLADEEFKSWVLDPSPTPEKNKYWQKWIETHPDNKELFLEAREIILAMKFKSLTPSEEQYEEVLSNILLADSLNDRGMEGSREYKTYSHYRRGDVKRFIFYKIAASVLLIISFILLFTFNYPQPEPEVEIYKPSYITKQNPKGQKSTFALPDGTIVTLNAESSLVYPERFDSLSREVSLTGEAFFEVSEDAARKFVVKSKNILTTALGTSFNVRAYPEEPEIQVALATGKVLVELKATGQLRSERNMILDPGEKLIHNKHKGDHYKKKFNHLHELGWKDGILIFNDVDLPYFINTLERWYGVTFTVVGKKKDTWHIYGEFERKTLRETLEGLSFTYNIKYDLEGKNVTLYL